MTRAGWLGLLVGGCIVGLGLALVVLLPFFPTIDMFLLIAAFAGAPLIGAVVHGSLTRHAMGLLGDWDPQCAAAELQGSLGIGVSSCVALPDHIGGTAAAYDGPIG